MVAVNERMKALGWHKSAMPSHSCLLSEMTGKIGSHREWAKGFWNGPIGQRGLQFIVFAFHFAIKLNMRIMCLEIQWMEETLIVDKELWMCLTFNRFGGCEPAHYLYGLIGKDHSFKIRIFFKDKEVWFKLKTVTWSSIMLRSLARNSHSHNWLKGSYHKKGIKQQSLKCRFALL